MIKYLKTVGNIIGFVWCLPVSILVWFWMMVLYSRGKIDNLGFMSNFAFVWDVSADSWLFRVMQRRRWYGFAFGNNIIVKYRNPEKEILVKHENIHVTQNYIFGVLFFPVYFLLKVFVYFFMIEKHSYHDHPFERWARKSAGQKVDYTRDEWRDGPNDRWAWW